MKVSFEYDTEKDILNHKIIAEAPFKGSSSKIQGFFEQNYGNDFSEENLRQFIKGLLFSYYKIKDPKEVASKFQETWDSISNTFQDRAEAVFGISLPGEIKAFLTTNDRCGLSVEEGFFFVNIGVSSPERIVMHELLHFYTYYLFFGRAKELNLLDKEYYDIKESLTEMLNLEFTDLMPGAVDPGYKGHEKLRDIVRNEWVKTRDINKVLKALVNEVR
jgi:hypothetical protein